MMNGSNTSNFSVALASESFSNAAANGFDRVALGTSRLSARSIMTQAVSLCASSHHSSMLCITNASSRPRSLKMSTIPVRFVTEPGSSSTTFPPNSLPIARASIRLPEPLGPSSKMCLRGIFPRIIDSTNESRCRIDPSESQK